MLRVQPFSNHRTNTMSLIVAYTHTYAHIIHQQLGVTRFSHTTIVHVYVSVYIKAMRAL